jgi:hypothetical protein
MSDGNIRLLLMWYHKSKLYYNCHRDTAEYYSMLDKWLGLPAILINVFNTTSLFSNYQSINTVFILFIAILSLFSAMLTASQNYFEFNNQTLEHKKMMIEYSKILYSIEKTIILIKNDNSFILNQDIINTTLNSLEKLREVFIYFPEKIWIKNNNLFKLKLDELDVNTSDSVNIILQSIKNKKNFSFDDVDNGDKNSEIITYSNVNKIKIDNLESPNLYTKSKIENKEDNISEIISITSESKEENKSESNDNNINIIIKN